ncbi:MAG: hypothetical protein LC734_11695 [Acidobacteria bacterium]|nr:hypothetical protein [Acidobacteriota bacterium]
MKFKPALISFVLFTVSSSVQAQSITKDEFDSAYRFAVSETNAAFPFVFTVTTEFIENGKTDSTVIDVHEREAQGRERTTRKTITDGKTTHKYQIKVGFGKNFCSDDGLTWTPNEYECFGPVSFYGRREPESVEYSVTGKRTKGKKAKVLRQYSVFAPLAANAKKDFREKILTLDSRGFFIDIVDKEGTLDPLTVKLIRRQSWDTKTKFKPVIAPVR